MEWPQHPSLSAWRKGQCLHAALWQFLSLPSSEEVKTQSTLATLSSTNVHREEGDGTPGTHAELNTFPSSSLLSLFSNSRSARSRWAETRETMISNFTADRLSLLWFYIICRKGGTSPCSTCLPSGVLCILFVSFSGKLGMQQQANLHSRQG